MSLLGVVLPTPGDLFCGAGGQITGRSCGRWLSCRFDSRLFDSRGLWLRSNRLGSRFGSQGGSGFPGPGLGEDFSSRKFAGRFTCGLGCRFGSAPGGSQNVSC